MSSNSPAAVEIITPAQPGRRRHFSAEDKRRFVEEVLAQLPGWMLDYNTVHPPKGLGMKSPAEFRALPCRLAPPHPATLKGASRCPAPYKELRYSQWQGFWPSPAHTSEPGRKRHAPRTLIAQPEWRALSTRVRKGQSATSVAAPRVCKEMAVRSSAQKG